MSVSCRLVFWGILLAYVAYGLAFIFRTTYVFEGKRHFILFDDAMISMTFARNLAQGHGLVWNAGDPPIEGFTNFGWVLWMAALHLLPFDEATISLPVQLTGLALLIANYFAVNRLATVLSGGNVWAGVFAATLCATYYPLTAWSLHGMEVGVLACLITVSTLWAVRDVDDWRSQRRALWLLAFGTLFRPDMVVAVLAMGIGVAVVAKEREARLRRLLVAAGIAGACVLIATGLRYWYFGELVPNTYLLKVAGLSASFRMTRGIFVFAMFALRTSLLILVIPLAYFVAVPSRSWLVAFSVIFGQVFYNTWVGGDAWERETVSRYLCVVAPVFFALLAASFAAIYAKVSQLSDRLIYARLAKCALVLLSVTVPLQVNLAQNGVDLQRNIDRLTLQWMPEVDLNASNLVTAHFIRQITDTQARVAVICAGATPYFSHRYSIDLLGKCDKVIARGPHHLPGEGWTQYFQFHPGHTKWDLSYSLGELRPDVTVLFCFHPETPRDKTNDPWLYLVRDYRHLNVPSWELFLRKDSPHIRWDEAALLGEVTEVARPPAATKQ